jgi:hypothetical protein
MEGRGDDDQRRGIGGVEWREGRRRSVWTLEVARWVKKEGRRRRGQKLSELLVL